VSVQHVIADEDGLAVEHEGGDQRRLHREHGGGDGGDQLLRAGDREKPRSKCSRFAGCAVELPRGQHWRGRPLYDFGMLKLARRQLEQILDRRRPEIRDGVEIAVGSNRAASTSSATSC
jgi:hypothetical protein